jgi:hypothetical protein
MKVIAAAALVAAMGLGSLVGGAAPASAAAGGPKASSVHLGGPSAEREIILGQGSCIWGAFSILGHHVVILERCGWEEDGTT